MKLKRPDYVIHSAAVVAKIIAKYNQFLILINNQFLRPRPPPLRQLSAVCGEAEMPCVYSAGAHCIAPLEVPQPSGNCESWQSLQSTRPLPEGLGFRWRRSRGLGFRV